jgi:hypothetical protein
MLKGIHFLLTYICNWECDHCFLYCSPKSKGTFTLSRIRQVLEEARKIDTMESIFFEGGEPFLFYPIMIEGLRMARDMGFKTGLVTNVYWGTSVEDAEVWLEPFRDLDLSYISMSDDEFHHSEEDNPAKHAMEAAERMGLTWNAICINKPVVTEDDTSGKGEPVVGGGAKFRGRAVEKLAGGLPTRPWETLTECRDEDLKSPRRVHVDPFGHVHICQGVCMGNMWKTPLSELDANYAPDSHPICGPLIRGGPAQLVREFDLEHEDGYVDECHLCYCARLALIDKLPDYLAPRQVYGLE